MLLEQIWSTDLGQAALRCAGRPRTAPPRPADSLFPQVWGVAGLRWGSSMKGWGRSSPSVVENCPYFRWCRRILGRRVCGAAVKAERPEAEPRTNGLEGGSVRAMLIGAGTTGIWGWWWIACSPRTGSREGGQAGVRLPVIHSPRRSGAWCDATGTGRGQSRVRPRRQLSGARPQGDLAPSRTEVHAAVAVLKARMWPSRSP